MATVDVRMDEETVRLWVLAQVSAMRQEMFEIEWMVKGEFPTRHPYSREMVRETLDRAIKRLADARDVVVRLDNVAKGEGE